MRNNFADDQIKCPEPLNITGITIDDETPSIADFSYGSKIK